MEVKGGAKFKPEPKNDIATYDFRAGDVPF
jgi:hypothetical protein